MRLNQLIRSKRSKFVLVGVLAVFLALLHWRFANGAAANADWQFVAISAPPGLQQKLDQDFRESLKVPHGTEYLPIDVGKMKMITIRQRDALPLYLINTRLPNPEHPGESPSCGAGGCTFYGYVPFKNGFRQVLDQLISDAHRPNDPPLVQPDRQVVDDIPCFRLNEYSIRTNRFVSKVWCFNSERFQPISQP